MIDILAYVILVVVGSGLLGVALVALFYDPDNNLGWLRNLLGWGIPIVLVVWAIWHVFKLPIPHFS